ncbi:alpha/beta fold hydrolase [Rhizobacter sp. LjRoot28]|jgi:pimeloyl-ACP methyl ester carboxylesterase|uniref:alpha/beta fold hydrolase n=1 Tax=Rhizobacter sp. LjRoot28 TaxID=3342309 RepID=UPI003ECC99CB
MPKKNPSRAPAAAAPAATGSLPPIVFSHANSFPAGTYRKLFEVWRAAGHEVHAVEKYGHDPKYPVSNHWPRLRDQLIHFAEKEVGRPAYFVGHSLGGFLSVLAAARRPDLACGVVLLDSPIIGGLVGTMVQFAKSTGFGARFSPGHVSQRRRHHWPTVEAAHHHFASKDAFARWDPDVLKDYIACGIEPAPPSMERGHTLAFRREVETDIYNTLPHDIPRFLRSHPLQCPLAFIGGTRSTEVRQVGMLATERIAHGRVSWIDGTHLYPFERPDETSAEVLRWLSLFEAPAAS